MYRSFLDTAAQTVGPRVIPEWRLKNWQPARRLSGLLQRLEIDTVLDVGANRGQYRDFLRDEVAFRGWIVSYEPQAALVEEMEQRATRDRMWRVHRAAVGRATGTLPLRVTHQDMFSSLLPARVEAVPKMVDFNTTARVEAVPVVALREVWPTLRDVLGVRRAFLKIDTQGFDLEVLAGAGDTLVNVPLIQSELSVQPLYEGPPSYLEAIRALGELGYVLAGLYPVSADGPKLVEMDGLFVRA